MIEKQKRKDVKETKKAEPTKEELILAELKKGETDHNIIAQKVGASPSYVREVKVRQKK